MTTMSTSLPAMDRAETLQLLFKNASHPLTLAQARQQLPSPKPQADDLARQIEEMIAQGGLFACSPIGKTPRFWGSDERARVRAAVEQFLADGQLSETALTSKVTKALPGITSPTAVRDILEQMKSKGQLHSWPGNGKLLGLQPYSAETLLAQEKNRVRQAVTQVLGVNTMARIPLISRIKRMVRKLSENNLIGTVLTDMQQEGIVDVWPGKGKLSTLYLVKPFNPASLIRKDTFQDLSTILRKAESLGVNLATFMQSLQTALAAHDHPHHATKKPEETHASANNSAKPTHDHPQAPIELMSLIIKGMRDVDGAAETGAPVQLRDLRQHMPAEYRGHDSFDSAVLQLAEEGRIILQRCDHPAIFAENQLNEMVRDRATGAFYISAAHKI